jgi:CBS domain-containing protein
MLGRENVLTVPPNIPLSQALELMYQAQVQDLIICTDSRYLGVVTWDELLKVPPAERLITRMADLPVKPLSVMAENSALDAYKVMIKERTRLVPVLNSEAPCSLMGVITNQSIAYNLETAKLWRYKPSRSS